MIICHNQTDPMIVPITVTPPNAFSPKLIPPIAKLGHDELFLIELQGTLDVQCPEWTAKDGQLIGTLNTTDMVCAHEVDFTLSLTCLLIRTNRCSRSDTTCSKARWSIFRNRLGSFKSMFGAPPRLMAVQKAGRTGNGTRRSDGTWQRW